MNCWAQIASGCAHVYPCLLCESEVGQGSTKRVCVCVYSELWHLKWCHVAKAAVPNSSREEVQALCLPALMCNSS